jgi:TPP-dependent indolepyruvate ferredoxin oxidoreductase alpha subunit
VEVQTVLRVSRPEILEKLRRSKAGRFLGESLGPVTIIVKPGATSKVQAALAEMGLLADEVHEE